MGVIIQKAGDRIDTQELPDLTRVLELYPEYYKQFQEAQDCLMAGDGSLPLQSRYYIAFLAIRYDTIIIITTIKLVTTITTMMTVVLFSVTLAVTL